MDHRLSLFGVVTIAVRPGRKIRTSNAALSVLGKLDSGRTPTKPRITRPYYVLAPAALLRSRVSHTRWPRIVSPKGFCRRICSASRTCSFEEQVIRVSGHEHYFGLRMDAGDLKLPTAHLGHYQVCEHQMNRLRVSLCDLQASGPSLALSALYPLSARYSAASGALW